MVMGIILMTTKAVGSIKIKNEIEIEMAKETGIKIIDYCQSWHLLLPRKPSNLISRYYEKLNGGDRTHS